MIQVLCNPLLKQFSRSNLQNQVVGPWQEVKTRHLREGFDIWQSQPNSIDFTDFTFRWNSGVFTSISLTPAGGLQRSCVSSSTGAGFYLFWLAKVQGWQSEEKHRSVAEGSTPWQRLGRYPAFWQFTSWGPVSRMTWTWLRRAKRLAQIILPLH